MRKSKYWVQTLAVALAVAGAANQARATLYKIGGTVGTDLQSGWNLNIDGNQDGGGNALVGNIKLIPDTGSTINTVCLDVRGTVYLGQKYDFLTKSFNGQDGLNPNWGWGNGPGNPALTPAQKVIASAAIQNAAYVFDKHSLVLTGTSLSDKAALQLAVWEALYDTGNLLGYSFATTGAAATAGRFEASGSSLAVATALDWLTADLGLDGKKSHKQYSGDLLQPWLNGSANTAAQEMMGTLAAVPEPSTIIAGALLLLPFGASTLRFVRKNRAA